MTKTYLVIVRDRYTADNELALRDTFNEAKEFIEESIEKNLSFYSGEIYELDTKTKEIHRWFNDGRGFKEID